MGDIENQNMDLREKDSKYKEDLQNIYNAYKKLFIQAEEKLEEMSFFVAPMLEHRDALDHLMRYFSLTNEKEITEEALRQLDKAVGHEFRAYFDVADYICITIRNKIAERLKGVSKKKIESVWQEYLDIKQEIVKISDEIADVRFGRRGKMASVNEYEQVLKKVFRIYDDFVCKIEPHL